MPFMHTMPFVQFTQCQLCIQCHLCNSHNANCAYNAVYATDTMLIVHTRPFDLLDNANYAYNAIYAIHTMPFLVLTQRSSWWEEKGTHLALLHNWHCKWHCLVVNYAELSPGNFDPGSLTKKLPQYIAANVTQHLGKFSLLLLSKVNWWAFL